MQLLVTLKKEKIRLPIATSEILQGLIYYAISGDSEYSKFVHNFGITNSTRAFKAFTFGELKGKYEIEGKEIIYLSSVSLEVRSADVYFIQLLYSYFSTNSIVKLGNNEVEVVGVELRNAIIFDDAVKIRTASPITVYKTDDKGHTIYYSPGDSAFYVAVEANARRKWESFYGTDEGFSFSITPQSTKFIKRATKYKTTYITAWHGRFVLKGPPKVLDFLYNTGLGSKNSQGFGMFDVCNTRQI